MNDPQPADMAQISGVHLPDIRDVQEIGAPAVGLCTGDGHQTTNRDMYSFSKESLMMVG
jgi:hypothetical protein